MKIIAAADGSALGNPGPAGWGWYVDDQHWASGGWPHGTNNMGELMAVLDLLQQTAHLDAPLHILCDSQYVINSVTKWMPGWKRNGWKKKDGKPVLNVDLMKAIDEAIAGRPVTFEWVKGHAGHHLNEKADDLANAAATAYQAGRAPNAGPGFLETAPSTGAAVLDQRDDAMPTRATQPLAAPQPSAPEPSAPAADMVPAPEFDLFSHFDDLDTTAPEAPKHAPEAPKHAPEAPKHAPAASEHAPTTPIDTVIASERALLDADVRSNPNRVAALLHTQFREIGTSGRLYTRDDVLEHIAPLDPPVELDVISAEQIDANTIMLLWRSVGIKPALRSSIWVRTTTGWALRFHQASAAPES
ncbi:ribonuclease HI family protein [Microbacterium sp. NC79]|uniref:RNase H family protein n=1 Tax=Microbacterium sp. NC79 TaxID=2851009 RepID=UPI001C2BC850|nr:DUF4440 domain-containing protein [Microbacterium sp. NC79]